MSVSGGFQWKSLQSHKYVPVDRIASTMIPRIMKITKFNKSMSVWQNVAAFQAIVDYFVFVEIA